MPIPCDIDMKRLSAPEAYKLTRRSIQEQLERLNEYLADHQKRHNADPGHWGLVGDLQSITHTLDSMQEGWK